MKKTTKLKLLHFIHSPFFFIWWAWFLIPTSVWSERIMFQFWYAILLVGAQVMWGIIVFGKVAPICPLTTWMQDLRGFSKDNQKNYGHAYIHEELNYMGIPISKKMTSNIHIASFIIVISQFILTLF